MTLSGTCKMLVPINAAHASQQAGLLPTVSGEANFPYCDLSVLILRESQT